jgi:WD40 repeat protein
VQLSALSFSPDGKSLAASITEWGPNGGRGGKASGGVQIWDIERSALIRTIEDDKPTTFLKYSVDGQSLATSSNDGPIKLWNATTGKLIRQCLGRSGADFSPDGETLACISAAPASDKTIGRVELYQLKDGSLTKSFTTAKGISPSYLLSVAFSPDGQLLAATDWNGTVTVWNIQTGKQSQSISNNSAGAHVGVFAPNNRTLAIGREDKTLQLWNLSADSSESK